MLNYFYRLKRKKGFTLVELIIVIVIIGVLAAVLIPVMSNYFRDAQIKTANSTAHQIKKIISTFMAEMEIQHAGMKQIQGVNAQMIFMIDKGEWIVKTECKVNGKNDTDGSLTFFDHKNWWNNNKIHVLLPTTTKNDPDHTLALCRSIADSCRGLDTGFIMAFFSAGVCIGVVYIPNCNYIWPQTNYSGVPSSITRGRPQLRPLIVHGRTDPEPRLKEFSPWAGTWPVSADDRFWSGVAGIDKDGYVVGTAPEIAFL